MEQAGARVVIAGGGPAGMMCGYLLARAGISVTVLEKHADFLRDFRGDTIHTSTLNVMHQLGLLADFLKRPHQEIRYAEGEFGDTRVRVGDFSHLPAVCQFVAFMPQWDFLDFLAERARALPTFTLRMRCEARALLRRDGRVNGLEVQSPGGSERIEADLVIVADGRDSTLRKDAGLTPRELGAPMDVLWFRIAAQPGDAQAVLGRIVDGRVLVQLFRGDYLQCALIIRKGSFEKTKAEGLDAFRRTVAKLVRRDSADEITSWDDVKLLTVEVNRLDDWVRPGLLCIGDAAHAMSPVGGVGINLAIQDAVAAANLLYEPLRRGTPSVGELRRVQRRRHFPTWATQAMQVFLQDHFLDQVLESGSTPPVPGIVRLLQRYPVMQRLPARVIALGFRQERVRREIIQR